MIKVGIKRGFFLFLLFCSFGFSANAKTLPISAGYCAIQKRGSTRSGALRLAVYQAKAIIKKKLRNLEKNEPYFSLDSLKDGFLEKYDVETSIQSSKDKNNVCVTIKGNVSFKTPEKPKQNKTKKVKKQTLSQTTQNKQPAIPKTKPLKNLTTTSQKELDVVPISKKQDNQTIDKKQKIAFMPVKFYNGSETKTLLTPLKKAFNENNFLVVGIKDKPDIIISPLVKQVDLTKAYSKLERLDVTIRLDLGFANSKKAGIYEEKMLSKIIQSEADKQEKAREIILQGFEITGQKLKKRLFTKINKTSKRQKEINELIKKYKTKNEKGKKEKKNKPVPLYDLTKPNSVKSYSN